MANAAATTAKPAGCAQSAVEMLAGYGIDRRTKSWRRLVAEVERLVAEFGGDLTASEVSTVVRAALAQIASVDIGAKMIRGEFGPSDADTMVRHSNAAARAIADLRRARATRAKAGSRGALASFMASMEASRG